MDFIMGLVLKYTFFTAAVFLTGMVMHYFFDDKADYIEDSQKRFNKRQ